MRNWFHGVAVALALVGLVAAAAGAWAATSVDLKLVDNGQAVGGAQIEILNTTGMTEATTDANGLAHFEMNGTYFRVHYNGRTQTTLYQAGQGLVVVDVHNN